MSDYDWLRLIHLYRGNKWNVSTLVGYADPGPYGVTVLTLDMTPVYTMSNTAFTTWLLRNRYTADFPVGEDYTQEDAQADKRRQEMDSRERREKTALAIAEALQAVAKIL